MAENGRAPSSCLTEICLDLIPRGEMAAKQKEFNDLPTEMVVEVFKYVNIHEIAFRYTEICIHWRENIALHILAPEIIRQAEANPSFKKLLEKNGWTEECDDVEMLIYIYNKTINPITSEFIFLAMSCSNNIDDFA